MSSRRRRGCLAPLPLLFALWGVFASGGGNRRFVDVLWCGTTLAAKPLILVHTALLEPTAVAYWLIVAVAIVVPALGLLLLRQRVRPWALLAMGVFCSLLILADVVYYRFFGDVLSTPAMLAARQTGHVWGSIGSLFTPGLVWLVADWPIACWLAARVSRRAVATPSDSPRARVPMAVGAAAGRSW